jgi:hypothetical protein
VLLLNNDGRRKYSTMAFGNGLWHRYQDRAQSDLVCHCQNR